MQVKLCPILRPTMKQFQNFYEYIHSLDKKYKHDYGMVKVIPPQNWKPQVSDYEKSLQKLKVKSAIQQNVQGRSGYYQSKNIVQKQMTYRAYKSYAQKESKKVKGLSCDQKEKLFWKTLTYSSPIYGADLTGSLMDQTAGEWNMNKLNSLLKYAMPYRVKGVTQPYCYIGTWKAFFSWHKEDLDLSAINYIHEGEQKIWYSIASQDSHILENCAKQNYRDQYIKCKEFLRHKTFLINPQNLVRKYPELRISKSIHNTGEIMLVFGGAYHEGFNCGFNIAEAVNYATQDWLGKILTAKPCPCSKKSVKASIQSILYNLQSSIMFESLLKNQSFQNIRLHVQQMQIDEQINNKNCVDTHVQPKKQLVEIYQQEECLQENQEQIAINKTKKIKKNQKIKDSSTAKFLNKKGLKISFFEANPNKMSVQFQIKSMDSFELAMQ